MVASNAWMSNGFECQIEDMALNVEQKKRDGSKCQTKTNKESERQSEDAALNAKLKQWLQILN